MPTTAHCRVWASRSITRFVQIKMSFGAHEAGQCRLWEKRVQQRYTMNDTRPKHLGWIETRLRIDHPDLPRLRLSGQAHYTAAGFAFVDVFGVEDDNPLRRTIRSAATDLLRHLGHDVELERGRDVFSMDPIRPRSNHEAVDMLTSLQRELIERNAGD